MVFDIIPPNELKCSYANDPYVVSAGPGCAANTESPHISDALE